MREPGESLGLENSLENASGNGWRMPHAGKPPKSREKESLQNALRKTEKASRWFRELFKNASIKPQEKTSRPTCESFEKNSRKTRERIENALRKPRESFENSSRMPGSSLLKVLRTSRSGKRRDSLKKTSREQGMEVPIS